MEDDVEARIQIQNFLLSSSAVVEIALSEHDTFSDDEAVFISNDQSAVDGAEDYPRRTLRTLRQFAGCGRAPSNDSNANILYEVDTANQTSVLVTNIQLPDTDPDDTDDMEFYFIATIRDQGQSLWVRSQTITAIRWWADPVKNLRFQKTEATKIEPLIDGEAFFNRIEALIRSAKQRVYLASWSFWMDTSLTGEPGGGGVTLGDAIRAAAGRGIPVYILLDSKNGGWASIALRNHLSFPNVHVKISTHPETLLGRNMSYHEKFICVDGATAVVGGIDFMPDRYQRPEHAWKSDFTRFRAQWTARGMEAAAGFQLFDNEFMLWHDAAVLVEGPIVKNVEYDFARRWNQGTPAGNEIAARAVAPTRGNHSVQLVKTDFFPGAGDAGDYRATGTEDAYRQAILEARHYVYIENQYFNYRPLGDMLVEALEGNPGLQLILVIPFNTEEAMALGATNFAKTYWYTPGAIEENEIRDRGYLHGLFLQAGIIRRLRAVPNAANRVGIFALAGCAGSPTAQMIYPHSKTIIIDDTWALIGSANTNGRGFYSDGEMNVVIHKRSVVTSLRRALWREHLGLDLDTRDIRDFFGTWQARSLPPQDSPDLCDCAALATVHAVKLRNPPAGQEYDGPGSWLPYVDNQV